VRAVRDEDEGRLPGFPEAAPADPAPAGAADQVSLVAPVEESVEESVEERLSRLSARVGAAGGADLLDAIEDALVRIERERAAVPGAPPAAAAAPSAPGAPTLPTRAQPPTTPISPAAAPTPTPAATGAKAPARASSVRARRLQLTGRVLTGIGVFVLTLVVFELWLTGLVQARSQRLALGEFRGAMTSGLAYLQAGGPPEGAPVATLQIPAVQQEDVVVEGTTPELLKGGPGHLRDTPLPGFAGNAVLIGRRTTYGGPFRNIGALQPGDEIDVSTGLGAFRYLVERVKVDRSGAGDLLTTDPGNFLTLVTDSPKYGASARLAVVARLQGPPAATPPPPKGARPARSVDDDELGLTGDSGGLGPLLLWGELLVAAAWLSWRLRRRWNRRAAYLLSLPVLITLTFLVFENLDRLLPGAL
jgi:sortase A